jgi:hypothetical protein
MTVSARTTKTTQNCNGSLTDFSFNFAIYKQEDLVVIVRDAEQVETLLVLGTDYTVSSDDFDDGGIISTIKEVAEEFVPYAWPTGYTITIMLDIALTQETDLLYGGTFAAESIEKCSDKLTRIVQQLNEQLGRSIKFQKSSSEEDVEIDDLEAGKFIVVNAAGDGLMMGEVAGEPGQSPVSNIPYDKDTWDGKVDTSPSKNAIRNEWVNNRFTKGGTYATVMALSHGVFSALPVSNIAYGASWTTIVDTAASKKAIYDKIEAMGGGAGDVIGPAANTDDYVPQWNGADSKTLKNGFAITAAGKAILDDTSVAAQRTTLELLSAALRTAEDVLTDGSNLPDGHAIKTYGDANWGGGGAGDVVGPASATNNAISLFDGVTGKLIKDSTRLIEDVLTDGSNLPDGAAIKTYGDANWGGNYTNLTEFIAQTAWRLFYSNAAGDVTELALGTAGQYLKANGVTSAPTWAVPGGAGDVVGPATHAADYVPQWNGTPNSKILVAGFAITAAGKAILDDADVAAQRTTLGLGSAALRVAEDTLTDGSNLPDGAAIKTYGDTNWGGGGDVDGPASAVNNAIPLFNGVTGKIIKDSTRLIEDALTNGSNLPDGAAVKAYGDANWGSGAGWEQATGFQAGYNLTSGLYNALVGYQAGYTQTTAPANTSLGRRAGFSQDVGGYNVSLGYLAGYANYRHAGRTDVNGYGDYNVFVGYMAGYKTYGGYNVAIGMEAARYLCSGYDNTCVGLCAGRFMGKTNNIGGNYNCFLGSNTGIMQNSGDWNTYLGTSAGYGAFGGANPEAPNPPQGTGSNNTVAGGQACRYISSGNNNVIMGYCAALNLSSGAYNTGIGRSALPNITSGNYNTAIGYNAGAGITTQQICTCIGHNSNVTVSNGFVLGDANVLVGIRKTNPSVPLDVAGQIRTTGANSNITSGWNISVPTNRSVLLDGAGGSTGLYYDGSYIRLVKAGVVVHTW